jgi:hypothetical protein
MKINLACIFLKDLIEIGKPKKSFNLLTQRIFHKSIQKINHHKVLNRQILI